MIKLLNPKTIGLFVLLLVCIQTTTLIANNNLIAKNVSNDEKITQNIVKPLDSQNSALSLNKFNNQAPSEQQILSSQQTSSSNLSNPSNFSIDNLFSFLTYIYNGNTHTFVSTPDNVSYTTTITYMQTLATIKMAGLENYFLLNQESQRIAVANTLTPAANCASSTSCGFPIIPTQKNPSLSGTYGALMTFYLLNLENTLKQYAGQSSSLGIVSQYVLSRLKSNGTYSGFQESFDSPGSFPISSTYWGVESLAILQPIIQYSIPDNTFNGIINTLKSDLYQSGNGYYFNDSTVFISSVLKSFYAVSILQTLDSIYPTQFQSNSNATYLLSTVETGLPIWLANLQNTNGTYTGAVQAPESIQPNVMDTGAALATLDILNTSSTQFNITAANQFLVESQYKGKYSTSDIGGWGQNNATYLPNVNPNVNVEDTFYAILGLYSSGYITNNMHITLESAYGQTHNNNYYNNSIIAGISPTSLFVNIKLFTTTSLIYSFTNVNFSLFHIDTWNIKLNNTIERDIGQNRYFEYQFIIQNDTSKSYNWTWGIHDAFLTFELTNFSLLPNRPLSVTSFVIVRPDFSVSLNNTSAKPGNTLTGVITVNNATLNPQNKNIVPPNFGTFHTNLVYPNGTSTPVTTNATFTLNTTAVTYTFSTILPASIPLGDYNINVTLINGTTIFYSKQQILVNDTFIFSKILSSSISGGLITLYPNSPLNLKFNLSYETNNKMVNTSAYANFINNATKKQIFSVKLVYDGGITYDTASAIVPKQLIMGFYNVTIDLIWQSNVVKTSFNSTLSNSSIPYVHIDGQVIPYHDLLTPSSPIQYGETLNFTTQLQIMANNKIMFIDQSYVLTGEIYSNQSSTLIQTLTYSTLKNNTGQLIGKLESNINTSYDGNPYYYLVVKVFLNSTQQYVTLQSAINPGQLYQKAFNLSGSLQIDKNSIQFLAGGTKTNIIETPVIIVNFNIINTNNNLTINGLELSATLSYILANGTKTNITFNNPIVTIENSAFGAYQIQMPTTILKEGSYQINISTVKAVRPDTLMGSIDFQVVNTPIQTITPTENYIALLTLGFAVLVTLVGIVSNRKK